MQAYLHTTVLNHWASGHLPPAVRRAQSFGLFSRVRNDFFGKKKTWEIRPGVKFLLTQDSGTGAGRHSATE